MASTSQCRCVALFDCKTMQWFKFYGQDWLTDLKIKGMSVEDRLCFITLLCLASAADGDGLIKNCNEEAVIKLTDLSDNPYDDNNEYSRAKGFLGRCNALQIVTLHNNGDVTVNAFQRRQSGNLSNAERQKKYRERLKIKEKQSNGSNVTQSNDSNARIEENRIDKIHTGATRKKKPSKCNPLGAEILKAFEVVDPKNKTYYGNTTQRAACDFLIAEYGLEEVLKRVSILSKTNKIPYFPSITTPYQLKEKWVQLQDKVEQYKAGKINSKRVQEII